jgi:hypothetical protein
MRTLLEAAKWIVAVAGPFAILAAYISLAGKGGERPENGDLMAMAASLFAGLAAIWLTRQSLAVKWIATAAYVPIIGTGLFVWALIWACSYHGDCL